MLFFIFKSLLLLSGIFSTCIGMLTIFYWVKGNKLPADESNRINSIASWWIGLTKPEVLASSWKFFRQDVGDNMKDVESTIESDK